MISSNTNSGTSWGIFVIIALCIVGQATPILQPLFVGAMVDFIGISESLAGMVSAAEMTGFGISALTVAFLLPKYTKFVIGITSIVLIIAANVAASYAKSFEVLVLFRVFAGAGSGAAFALGSALAAGTLRPDRTFAIVTATTLVYAGIFVSTVPLAISRYGIAGGYLIVAIVGVIVLAIALSLPKEKSSRSGTMFLKNLRVPPTYVALILGACLLLYTGHGAVWTFQERMGTAIGMSRESIGAALGIAALAGLAGALIAVFLGTRIGRTFPLTSSLLISSFAALLIVYGPQGEYFYVASSLIAFSWFYGLPYLNGLSAEIDPTGGLAALVVGTLNIGQAVGPFVAALLVAGGGYVGIGWLAAVAYLICAAMLIRPVLRSDLA